jgi:hypothetical protein
MQRSHSFVEGDRHDRERTLHLDVALWRRGSFDSAQHDGALTLNGKKALEQGYVTERKRVIAQGRLPNEQAVDSPLPVRKSSIITRTSGGDEGYALGPGPVGPGFTRNPHRPKTSPEWAAKEESVAGKATGAAVVTQAARLPNVLATPTTAVALAADAHAAYTHAGGSEEEDQSAAAYEDDRRPNTSRRDSLRRDSLPGGALSPRPDLTAEHVTLLRRVLCQSAHHVGAAPFTHEEVEMLVPYASTLTLHRYQTLCALPRPRMRIAARKPSTSAMPPPVALDGAAARYVCLRVGAQGGVLASQSRRSTSLCVVRSLSLGSASRASPARARPSQVARGCARI